MYFLVCFVLMLAVCGNGQDVVEPIDKKGMCKIRNGYYMVDGSCDTYYECRKYRANKVSCPDGLNYNPATKWPEYPCSYPNDVPCIGRGVSQPPQPTAGCPRQFGFFRSPLADENDCGHYRLCAEGRAYDMACPVGLAFNINTARCDWPEYVTGCNGEAFLGFKCPAAQYDILGNPVVTNYRYEGDCFYFYSCQEGRARLLSCDEGLAFDPVAARCVDAERINCHTVYPQKEIPKKKEIMY